MSSGAAKLFFLLFSLVYLLSDTLATSDDEVVVNLKPIDLSQLILQKKNYIAPRAENPTTISTPTTTQTPSFAACGVANGNGKIYGGNETEPNEFPWQAFLKVDWIAKGHTPASNESSYCGGSLIGDRWILTSASCLVAPSHQGQKLVRVNVYLGGHNFRAASEINRKEFWSNQTVIHPDWNSTTQSGNVGLVNLSTVVKYSKFIRPICLPSTTEPDYVKQIVTLIGMGLTQHSYNSSLLLNKMTTSVVSNSQCNSTYKNLMTDRMMCTAGVANKSGICDVVDKGDPLMFKQPDGTFKQIGILSFTPTTDSGCQKRGDPLAYTRLSSYSSWIQDVVSSSPSSVVSISGTSSAVLFLFLIFSRFSMNI